ncbi:MAG: recombinase family protein [Campylobacterota bacterium]|nr:recombinase family protein [Campylobacterota bacterium]
MIYAYMRQVPNLENLVSQKQNILSFSHHERLKIDKEVVEYSTKNLLIEERDDFEVFLKSLSSGEHTVIVSSLPILSTKIDELVKIIGCVLSHHVNLWICSANIVINRQSSMVDVFSLLEEQRVIPKDKSGQIGRPKGSKSGSKFDVYHSRIIELLSQNESVSAIARTLNVSRSSLKDYIESRGLKELVSSIVIPSQKIRDKKMDNIVLICPFELESHYKIKEKVS